MSEGTWEFFTRIAEGCETMRQHSDDFVKEEFGQRDSAVHRGKIIAFHLRQAEKYAREIAGVRPDTADGSPEHPRSSGEGSRESGVQR